MENKTENTGNIFYTKNGNKKNKCIECEKETHYSFTIGRGWYCKKCLINYWDKKQENHTQEIERRNK